MTGLDEDGIAVLEAISDPALVVAPDGRLMHYNRSAAQILGNHSGNRPLTEWAEDSAATVRPYVSRCLGSSSPLFGAITLRTSGCPQRFQARGARIGLTSGTAILLRLTRKNEERFQALTRKVDELDAEIVQRKRAEAVLQEILREREVLLRELQHRVKNNMQMLAAMLVGAAREAVSDDARAALADAAGRFSAVSAVQQLLYGSDTIEAVNSEELVATLVKAASAVGNEVEFTSRVDPVTIPIETAVPVALILNELLTNALKYGRPVMGTQCVGVEFSVQGDQVRLEVRDNGPGFAIPQATRRASGVGLVKALLRQVGGRLEVAQADGGRCVATFSVPQRRSKAGGA